MASSIYIGNEKLQAVSGKLSGGTMVVEGCATVMLPQGSLINGMITDGDAVREAINQLYEKSPWLSKKKIHLAINSSAIHVKRATMPNAAAKQVEALIKAEFADVGDPEEYLFDYASLERQATKGSGFSAVLAAARKDFIESYVGLLAEAGITIEGINVPQQCLINLVDRTGIAKEKTCIVMVLDGNILDAALFVDGMFVFANRSRLLLEQGAGQLEMEVGRIVSSLIQFNTTQRMGGSVSHLYLCGLNAENEGLHQSVSRMYGLEAGSFEGTGLRVQAASADFKLEDFVFPVGNLIRK